ncbi:MAG TPA: OadG family protein [Clostridia bacterium]|jgi:Na+-transporting methylmalonyl-CoA/oxaloacetate decarboxylase gamma subunit|nr:OadG family protein [Clostridiaceae bacterium]HOA31834.1 OadG family protein [Clostridia bacterium]HPZ52739.1 OadG family protein [Clostridia bacterium]
MDWNLIKEGLLIMLKGMTGIFVVMLVIYLFIHLLSWITNRKANEEKN